MKLVMLQSFQEKGMRSHQEDFFGEGTNVCVLADGFGGAGVGDKAAKLAVEALKTYLARGVDPEATMPFVLKSYVSLAGNILFNAVLHANQSLLDLFKDTPPQQKGACSLIAGTLDKGLLSLVNVGATQAWLLRDDTRRRIAAPKNLGSVFSPGSEDLPEYYKSPLIALGLNQDFEPEVVDVRLKLHDKLILGSGGLDPKLLEKCMHLHFKSEACSSLFQGSLDNVSVCVFEAQA